MDKTIFRFGLLLAIAAAPASANDNPDPCPPLPQEAGLHWQHSGSRNFTVCRAVDEGGTQLLGVMLTPQPTVNLRRRNRVEEGIIGPHEVHWYRPEIAEPGAEEKRVTVIELGKDRYAQIWVDANDPDQLRRALAVAQALALH